MRRFTVVVGGLLSFCGLPSAASAADLPAQAYPAAPAAAPLATYNWTGCHVGGHVGGVVSEDMTANGQSFSSAGFAGGGQIGCDYQFAFGWVAGVEGRAAWSSLKNSHASSLKFPGTGIILPSQFALTNDFLASATARVGYSFADRWLVFERGGAAWTQEKIEDGFTTLGGIAVDPSATMTRTGWTVGAGVEYAFSRDWTATLEYDYYDFGGHGVLLTSGTASVRIISLKDTMHEITIGLNYHF